MKNKRYYLKLSRYAAIVARHKKAQNISIFDVESKTGLYYYAILMSALSTPHIRAIEEEISLKFKKEKNEYILHRDGIDSANWKVIDYGGIVIHIFEPETRDFFALDKIYSDCKKVKWEETKRTTSGKRVKSKKLEKKK
jgi:ribosome-associated protein